MKRFSQFLRESKDRYDEMADKIHHHLKDSEHVHHGIRVDYDHPGPVGDWARDSRVWDNNELTDDTLNGTSALEINPENRSHIHSVLHTSEDYGGKHISVLGSDYASHGQDPGEKVMKNAKILMTFKRPGKTK